MADTLANVWEIRRWKSWPNCGRLIVLDTNEKLSDPFNLYSNAFSIDFPAMPEQIELARTANYRVQTVPVMPDGVHQYLGTNPLEIPFSFKIHHGDTEYCREGPLTLLQIAARLHALVVPLGESQKGVSVKNDGPLNDTGGPQPGTPPTGRDAVVERKSGQASTPQGGNSTGVEYFADSTNAVDPPVTVRLELIMSRLDSVGIICTGYVKDVRCVLFGPWLRGPDSASNLPSAGEYSFTFVHRPGHGNWFSNTAGASAAVSVQAQAYAQFIRERLYNTRDLSVGYGQYRGWQVPQI